MAILNSKIILAKGIKMDREYNNVLSFGSNQILNILNNNEHYVNSSNTFAFIGGNNTNVISCPFTYNECLISNYIAFQNPNYSNKWFFAFITNVIYKSNGMTQIEFEVDAWSTWFEDWQKKPCYIIREHVNDDTIGLHTLQEDLNIGDVIQEDIQEDSSYTSDYWIVVESAWQPNDNSTSGGEQFSGIGIYNKSVFGTKLYLFKYDTDTSANSLPNLIDLGLFLLRTNGDKHINDVTNIYIIPDAVVKSSKLQLHTAQIPSGGPTFSFYEAKIDTDIVGFDTSISKVTSFNGLSIKNNKCFCYPYNYLLVSNNMGNNNIFKYEDFYNQNNCVFKNQLAICNGVSGRIVPYNHKGKIWDYDEALPLAKYPTCSWSSDAFINWLSANAVNNATQLGMLAGGIAATMATGGAAAPIAALAMSGATQSQQAKMNAQQNLSNVQTGTSMGLSISSTVAGQIGGFYSASLLPNIQGNQPTGDIAWASNSIKFTFRKMRVKDENIKIIDDYFSRYGYKINRVLEPNIIGRENFNYIEIGSTEEIGNGDVPVQFMEKINNACRRGVTIWHNHENIGNYNINNNIV